MGDPIIGFGIRIPKHLKLLYDTEKITVVSCTCINRQENMNYCGDCGVKISSYSYDHNVIKEVFKSFVVTVTGHIFITRGTLGRDISITDKNLQELERIRKILDDNKIEYTVGIFLIEYEREWKN